MHTGHQDGKMNDKFKAFLTGMAFGFFLGVLLLLPSKVMASDPNGDEYCLAQNIYFEAGNQPLAVKLQ